MVCLSRGRYVDTDIVWLHGDNNGCRGVLIGVKYRISTHYSLSDIRSLEHLANTACIV